MNLENLLLTILLEQILYMEYPFGHCYGITYYAQLSDKTGAQKLFSV